MNEILKSSENLIERVRLDLGIVFIIFGQDRRFISFLQISSALSWASVCLKMDSKRRVQK